MICSAAAAACFMLPSLKVRAADNINVKDFILLEQQHKEAGFDVNGDHSIDVLDLCRGKNDLLYADERRKEPVTVSMGGIQVDYDNMMVRVPLRIKNQSYDIKSIMFYVDYDRGMLTLTNATAADGSGNCSVSQNNGSVMFSSSPGQDLRKDGDVLYAEFTMNPQIRDAQLWFGFRGFDIACSAPGAGNTKIENSQLITQNTSSVVSVHYIPVTTTPPVTTVITTTTTTVTTTEATTVTTVPVTTPVTTVTTTPVTTTPPPSADITPDEQKAIELINEWRAECGYYALKTDNGLCMAADVRTKELATVFDFDRPDGNDCVSLLVEMKAKNPARHVQYIYKGSGSPEGFVSWLKSFASKYDDTDVNKSRYTYIGVGYGSGCWSLFVS